MRAAGERSEGCAVCYGDALGLAEEGGLVHENPDLYVCHIPNFPHLPAYRGWLIVAPKRHVTDFAGLTVDEAQQMGVLVRRAAQVLEQHLGAEHTYNAAFGDAVPHLHMHVLPRYPGTPRDHWGWDMRRWDSAPRVATGEMRALVSELSAVF